MFGRTDRWQLVNRLGTVAVTLALVFAHSAHGQANKPVSPRSLEEGRAELDQVRSEVERLRADIVRLERLRSASEAERQAHDRARKQLVDQNSAIDGMLQSAKAENATLQELVRVLQLDASKHFAELRTVRAQVGQLERKLVTANEARSEHASRIEELAAALTASESQNALYNRRLGDYESQVATLGARAEALGTELESAKERLATLAQSLADTSAKLTDAEQSNVRSRAELEAAQSAHASTNRALEGARQDVEQLEMHRLILIALLALTLVAGFVARQRHRLRS
jgi:chromosome segregation ATPase